MPRPVYVWSDWGDALGVARRLHADGVRVQFRIDHPETHGDIGRGLIQITQSAPPRGALIFFDATGHGARGALLRKLGHPVIGGNRLERRLEGDRAEGARIAASVGITVPETHGFRSLAEAERWLAKQDERAWFVKFSGDHETALTRGTRSTDAMIRHLRWIERTRPDLAHGVELQGKVEGCEVSCEGWWDGKKFVPPFNATFEDKKFLAGGHGDRTGCYDAETEILTEDGWCRHESLTVGQRVLARDPITGESTYEVIERIWRYDWDGPMVAFRGQRLDLLVTPDHSMLVHRHEAHPVERLRADLLLGPISSHATIPKTSRWKGQDIPYFVLPEYRRPWPRPLSQTLEAHQRRRARGARPRQNQVVRDFPPIQIPMDMWLAFLGLYVSEGHVQGARVVISQKEPSVEINRLLSALPWAWARGGHQWTAYAPQLATYLRGLGKSYEKYLPREVMDLSPRQLSILLTWLLMGDGSVRATGQRTYYTSSPRLAADVQEIAQKIGVEAVVRVRDRRGRPIVMRRTPVNSGVTRHLSYEVSIYQTHRQGAYLSSVWRGQEHYRGTVWCVTVASGSVYVRRHGQPTWCGNCEANVVWFLPGEAPPLAAAGVLKLASVLGDYVGPIDVNGIVAEDGTLSWLEASARPGWDACLAFMHHFDGTFFEQLEAFATGTLDHWEPVDPTALSLTLRVSVPPYPLERSGRAALREAKGMPIDPAFLEQPLACPVDVMVGPDGLALAGASGQLGTLGAVGHDLKALRRTVLDQAMSLDIDALQFRIDPVKRAERDWQRLVKAGRLDESPEEGAS